MAELRFFQYWNSDIFLSVLLQYTVVSDTISTWELIIYVLPVLILTHAEMSTKADWDVKWELTKKDLTTNKLESLKHHRK